MYIRVYGARELLFKFIKSQIILENKIYTENPCCIYLIYEHALNFFLFFFSEMKILFV